MTRITNVYFIQCPGYIKVGIADDVDERLAQLQTGNPHPLRVRFILENVPDSLERVFHSAFIKQRAVGEWFRFRGDVRKAIVLMQAGARPRNAQDIQALMAFAPKKGYALGYVDWRAGLDELARQFDTAEGAK